MGIERGGDIRRVNEREIVREIGRQWRRPEVVSEAGDIERVRVEESIPYSNFVGGIISITIKA